MKYCLKHVIHVPYNAYMIEDPVPAATSWKKAHRQ